jgi:anti-anti-sigma regulatory factor
MSDTTLTLPENLTIHQIEAHFGGFKLALDSEADVFKLDAGEVESVDTAGLQSLLVLIKQLQGAGKQVEWLNTGDVVTQAAERIGLTQKLQLAS